jgi:carbonic anhydrase
MKCTLSNKTKEYIRSSRRSFLGTSSAACLIGPASLFSLQLAALMSGSLAKEQRDRMTPAEIIEELKKGKSSASGQYPAAVVLGCVDSRVPPKLFSM